MLDSTLEASAGTENLPDTTVSAREAFGLDVDVEVPAYTERTGQVPDIDPDYLFDERTTMAILSGFVHDWRVLVSARLNWPCLRINLDSHVSRIDLIGKDAIVLRDGKQVTEFQDGILPWAYQRNVALVFDEYDAGRPDVMFVIQRVLESAGRLTLLDQSRVLRPHPAFRFFATANTVGLGDTTGLYHGTQQINQAQMDRWNITTILNYLPYENEVGVVLAKAPHMQDDAGKKLVGQMVRLASMTRSAFQNGDIATVMSPRTVINWTQNVRFFDSVSTSFELAFLNKCDSAERDVIMELYQRAFGEELDTSESRY